jgi:hypothetical protein
MRAVGWVVNVAGLDAVRRQDAAEEVCGELFVWAE